MNKKYLMNGFAALALIASVSSCTKDVTAMSQEEIDVKAKENAELQLGISIPDGQTWNMASQVEANVTVNGDYGADYTVTIYENNPAINNTGVVLGKTTVKSGNTANLEFTCPNALDLVFAAIKDVKGYTYVQPASIVDGKVVVEFGDATSGSRAMRAASTTNGYVDIPTGAPKATIEAQAAEILAKSVELNETNNEINTPGYYWTDNGGGIVKNENYVINYLISGEWNGLVKQLGSVGHIWGDELVNGAPSDQLVPRTVYVKGKWTIPSTEGSNWQVCGNGWNSNGTPSNQVDGIIVVGEKGELVVNGTLNMANLARLIVLPGGKVTGTGTINVNNGSKVGEESYNYGTISVATFNENFGNFFNYGTMTCNELQGGAGTSCYVNHGKVLVDHVYPNGQQCANLQIKNNCWWEVTNANYCKIFQNAANAYAKMGSLNMSAGEGGEGLGSYLSVDTGSRVYVVNDFSGNNTSIIGPTSGDYAYICVGGYITQWNFTNNDDHVGMIINNIKIYARPNGNAEWNWTHMLNENLNESWGSWVDNKKGNNHVESLTAMDGYNTATVEASECAPAFTPQPPTPIYETLKVYTYAFEDQTVGTDYDMNDVVLKVSYKVKSTNAETGKVEYDKTKLVATLVAAGATYNIKVKIGETYLFDGAEIHEALGVNAGVMVNTGNGKAQTATPVSDEILTEGLADGDGNIDFTQLPVTIEVTSTGKNYSYPNTDNYPHAVMIPVDWRWPLERIIVTEAYPGTSNADEKAIDGNEGKKINGGNYPVNSFAAWAATPAAQRTATMNGWYNHPHKGKTMTNESPATND